MRRLPPLSAYRAFEAAARHCNFKEAARELHVSPSAISHQIRVLEEHLGINLFRRLPGSIELSEDGERLLPDATRALDLIASSTKDVTEKRPTVYVHCSTSFALQWAARRIGTFENAYPNIFVRLSTDSGSGPDTGEYIDLEISYETKRVTDPNKSLLLREWLLPVCSPDYLAGETLAPSDVMGKRILKNSPNGWDWVQWAKQQGLPRSFALESLETATTFDVDSAAILSAVSGLGIALVNLNYVRSEMESGLLVPASTAPPFALGGHFLNRRKMFKPYQEKFVNWLEQAANESTEEISQTHGLEHRDL